MGWFTKKTPESEKDWQTQVEEALDALNDLLEQRPPAYKGVRPYIPATNYDRGYQYTVVLAKWNIQANGFDILYESP